MLITTDNTVFLLSDPGSRVAPVCLAKDCKPGAVIEHKAWQVALSEGGRYRVWHDGAPSSDWRESGIENRVTSALVLDTAPLTLLIGAEPPHVYRLEIGVGTAVRMEAFDRLECRKDWFTPWGGPPAVRSMARGGGETVYADIHVGSIMRSDDRGRTWNPVTPELHQDVHQVNTAPAAPDRVYANTADAVWISYDRGDSWEHRPFPIEQTYGRAITIHPEDPDCVLASVSDGPHGDNVHGHLFRSDDAGKNWTQVTEGFPESTRENINTHRIAFDKNGDAWAAAGKTLYCSKDRGVRWKAVWEAPEEIEMLEA